mgnify:FL=1
MSSSDNQIIIYQTEDGTTKIDLKMEDETVWLSQSQMAELFQTTKQNISLHINNCFKDGEVDENAVVKECLTTALDGKAYRTKQYNLDVIISVGYRVRSLRGTQFRIWANSVLKEYLKKGFAMNDDLLKKAGGGSYWHELLERIRDIRSSEKVFYRQILDIYGTSLDYTAKGKNSILFFQTVQNKMHYAAHGHTAAEVLMERANAESPFMGMTTFEGKTIKKRDITVAKNYLYEDEIKILNRIVTAYLEFAELQAIRHIPMYMNDWIKKLDDFIKLSGSELLENSGKVSHLEATTKAMLEFEKYKEKTKDDLSSIEIDFLDDMKKVQKKLEKDGGRK